MRTGQEFQLKNGLHQTNNLSDIVEQKVEVVSHLIKDIKNLSSRSIKRD